jgi:hypothetical protein
MSKLEFEPFLPLERRAAATSDTAKSQNQLNPRGGGAVDARQSHPAKSFTFSLFGGVTLDRCWGPPVVGPGVADVGPDSGVHAGAGTLSDSTGSADVVAKR